MASLEDLTADQLLARARELEGSERLLKSLSTNPATRETIQRAIKAVNPNVSIPELDSRDAMQKALDEEREERKKLEMKVMEREARDNVRERREQIRKKYNLTDADVEAVEKMMVDDKEVNWTHDAAARVYIASRQSATPTPASYKSPTYEMPEKDIWGKGIGNKAALDRIGLDEAFKAANEIRSGKVAGVGSAFNN